MIVVSLPIRMSLTFNFFFLSFISHYDVPRSILSPHFHLCSFFLRTTISHSHPLPTHNRSPRPSLTSLGTGIWPTFPFPCSTFRERLRSRSHVIKWYPKLPFLFQEREHGPRSYSHVSRSGNVYVSGMQTEISTL